MERNTIEFTLPITKKIVKIKEWITGREYEEMQKPLYENYKMRTEDGKQMTEMNGDLLDKVNKLALSTYLVSIDGVTENLIDTALDLPYQDYKEIKDQIDEIQKKK